MPEEKKQIWPLKKHTDYQSTQQDWADAKEPSLELYSFTSFTFTGGGLTYQRRPPSHSQLTNGYNFTTYPWLSTYWTSNGNGIQSWTVPADATYRIEAHAARGADENNGLGSGGVGAKIIGEFDLNESDVVKIVCGYGGRGGPSVTYQWPGGAGGTFLWINDPPSDPLLIAGGGAGTRSGNSSSNAKGQGGENAGRTSQNPSGGGTYGSAPGQDYGSGVGEGSWLGPNNNNSS